MTTKEFNNYVLDCLFPIGICTTRPMMGEYLLYFRGKHVGDLCDNRLLVRVTETSKKILEGAPMEYPYEGSKTKMIVVEDLEDTNKMKELFEALHAELPLEKEKRSRQKIK